MPSTRRGVIIAMALLPPAFVSIPPEVRESVRRHMRVRLEGAGPAFGLASVGTLVLGLRCSCIGTTADASRLARAVQKAFAPENRLIGAGLLHRNFLSCEDSMHTLIIMDHTGDSRHQFDPNDSVEVLDAERRFRELNMAGFAAAKRTANGMSEVIRQFDPTVRETLFIPRLVGG
jgi:hypothetical protein